MVIALDESGAWVVPIGATSQTSTKGLMLNGEWLYTRQRTNRNLIDDIVQEIGDCEIPRTAFNTKTNELSVEINLSATCLSYAVHRSGGGHLTSKLSASPKIAFYRSGLKEFPVKAENVTGAVSSLYDRCWNNTNITISKKYLKITAIPNNNELISVNKKLKFKSTGDLTVVWDQYMRVGVGDSGTCTTYS